MSVENISLFHSVLDEALVRLGKKNLKLKECQYEARYGRHTMFCWSITDYPIAPVSFPRDRRLGERDCKVTCPATSYPGFYPRSHLTCV